MNKYILTLFACFIIATTQAQTSTSDAKKSSYSKPSKDYLMFQLGYHGWANLPDSVKTKGIGREANLYLCYDFPIAQSNVSFAAGIGVGSNSVYLKDQEMILKDTNSYVKFIPEATNYKKYKVTTTYIEAPFELRYFQDKANRNKGIKAAIGLKVGALVSSHTKGKYTYNSKPIIDKVSTKRFLESWRYSATARIGYGNFSLYGSYSLGNLFRAASGPENVRPFSIGICLSGL